MCVVRLKWNQPDWNRKLWRRLFKSGGPYMFMQHVHSKVRSALNLNMLPILSGSGDSRYRKNTWQSIQKEAVRLPLSPWLNKWTLQLTGANTLSTCLSDTVGSQTVLQSIENASFLLHSKWQRSFWPSCSQTISQLGTRESTGHYLWGFWRWTLCQSRRHRPPECRLAWRVVELPFSRVSAVKCETSVLKCDSTSTR